MLRFWTTPDCLSAQRRQVEQRDEAQGNVEQLQVRLGNFRKELSRISIRADIRIYYLNCAPNVTLNKKGTHPIKS